MEAIIALVVFLILIIGVAVFLYSGLDTTKPPDTLANEYKQALEGTDKRHALKAGRAYYGSLRKGKTLTVYDEAAISNDLSIMNSVPVNNYPLSLSKL